jgi:hypothetical protein
MTNFVLGTREFLGSISEAVDKAAACKAVDSRDTKIAPTFPGSPAGNANHMSVC